MKPTYNYFDGAHTASHDYLLPVIDEIVSQIAKVKTGGSILDLGCGNGSLCGHFAQKGFQTTGVDSSQSGIQIAKKNYSESSFFCFSLDEPVPRELKNKFDIVISTEVIEHLYFPRNLLKFANECLKPGGVIAISTPYHGYLKNLCLSLTNHWDRHFTVEWDCGHIKFFSVNSLRKMALESGFESPCYRFAGRLPYLWKSMICVARKPKKD